MRLGPGGRPVSFNMNDRCAAGTGRFIEMVAQVLGLELAQTGALALEADGACRINSMCAVFAETEIVGLTQAGESPPRILRGVFTSIARRTLALLAGLQGGPAEGRLVFTGGVARNVGVVRAIGEEAGREPTVPSDPQITGALGAAIIAHEYPLTPAPRRADRP
jgi:predicted CoA-substrate-specific enzyme activase